MEDFSAVLRQAMQLPVYKIWTVRLEWRVQLNW